MNWANVLFLPFQFLGDAYKKMIFFGISDGTQYFLINGQKCSFIEKNIFIWTNDGPPREKIRMKYKKMGDSGQKTIKNSFFPPKTAFEKL